MEINLKKIVGYFIICTLLFLLGLKFINFKDEETPALTQAAAQPKKEFQYVKEKKTFTHTKNGIKTEVSIKENNLISSVSIGENRIEAKLTSSKVLDPSIETGLQEPRIFVEGADSSISYEPIHDVTSNGIKENIILDSKNSTRKYEFELNLTGATTYKKEKGGDWIFYDKLGVQVFYIPRGIMTDAKGATSNDVGILISKKNGKDILSVNPDNSWLDDESRSYPVVVDPSVVVSGSMAAANAQFGGLQRKVVYSTSSSAWYTFYMSSNNILYKKSSDGSTWGSPVTVASTAKANPSVWLHTDGKIYVTWVDTTAETIEVNTVDTASSDTVGTVCTSASLGTIGTSFTASVAVDSAGLVYLATTDTAGDTEAVVFKLTYGGCTFTDITSGSGLGTDDRPVLVTVGTNLSMVYQDGNLSHSVYSGSSWTSSNTTIASVTDNIYSMTTDGTNLWLLSLAAATTSTNFYKYNASSWSTETAPWTSITNGSSVSVSYAPSADVVYAHVIKDASNQAYWNYTATSSVLWKSGGAGATYGFTAGSLSELSASFSDKTTKVAVVLLQGSNIEFAFQDDATTGNDTDILTRIGANTDTTATTPISLFSRLAFVGVSTDTGANGTIFGRLGINTDTQQCNGTSCSNETLFGVIRNLPGRGSRSMLSQFGGDGSESTSGVCSTTGAIYVTAAIHQYAGGCSVGDGSTATSIHPSDGTVRGGLFLFFKGSLTITNNAKIDVTGYGAQGGNGASSGIESADGGEGGGPNGSNGQNGVDGSAPVRLGGTGDPNSVAGAGGGGGDSDTGCGGCYGPGAGGGGGGRGGNGTNVDADKPGIATPGSNLGSFLTKRFSVFKSYGAGGGGGGVPDAFRGAGGGGGGGGVIWIRTHTYSNSGTLSVNGGLGGNMTASVIAHATNGMGGNGGTAANGGRSGNGATDSNRGGGGGGKGGGVLYIEADSVTINSTGGLYARGGNGGNGGNDGAGTGATEDGGNGANGFIFVEIVP